MARKETIALNASDRDYIRQLQQAVFEAQARLSGVLEYVAVATLKAQRLDQDPAPAANLAADASSITFTWPDSPPTASPRSDSPYGSAPGAEGVTVTEAIPLHKE